MLNNPDKSKLSKDESLIPQNTQYCSVITESKLIDGRSTVKHDVCPYLDYDDEKLEHESGYCHFIEKGDWEISCGLLWDGCKECGISMPLDEND